MPFTLVHETKWYRWHELSDRAKEHIQCTSEMFWDWERCEIAEMLAYELDMLDLSPLRPGWSLSYSQGDGVQLGGTLNAGDLIDHEQWVDCWAGFPESLHGADLDPDRLVFKIQPGRGSGVEVEALYTYSHSDDSDGDSDT